MRKILVDYDPDSEDLEKHLGNLTVQKNVEGYKDVVNTDYMYDMRLFKYNFLKTWPHKKEKDFQIMMKKMKAAITYGVLSAQKNFSKRKGHMEIQAVDFVIDENFEPYLVEFNVNPYLVPFNPVAQ